MMELLNNDAAASEITNALLPYVLSDEVETTRHRQLDM